MERFTGEHGLAYPGSAFTACSDQSFTVGCRWQEKAGRVDLAGLCVGMHVPFSANYTIPG